MSRIGSTHPGSTTRHHRVTLVVMFVLAALLALPAIGHPAPPDAPPGKPEFQAQVRTTSYGIPHIKARDYAGVGYGLGYKFAENHACTMASRWVTVSAETSATFGPDGADLPRDRRGGSLASDLFWQRMIDEDFVGQMLEDTGPTGVMPEVRELVRGYTAGYNRYLEEVDFDIPDPGCAEAHWIRPITERDVYHQTLHWDVLSFLTGEFASFAAAVPPGETQSQLLAGSEPADEAPLPISASNMIGLGSEGTQSGNGMVFGNPHWDWSTPDSFFDAHLTIPGELNVNGMTLNGTPAIGIGHNEQVGWSHTSSAGRTQPSVRYRLDLVPGSPTTYLVDGEEHEMETTTVAVEVLNDQGELETVEHTFYDTEFGTVSVAPNRPWTEEHAYTYEHSPLNVASLNLWQLYSQAETVDDLHAANGATMGMAWLNVVAADSAGGSYFAVLTPLPYITEEQIDDCAVGGGVLDGSRSACSTLSDPAAPYEGVFPPDQLPFQFRDDYVQNANNSHWVTNLREPLVGISPRFGPEGTPQNQRTRTGLELIEERLDGTDGLPGTGFTLEQLIDTTFDGRHFFGRLWQDELVTFCDELTGEPGAPDGLEEACTTLGEWDGTDELDDAGAVLFRRFIQRNGSGAARFTVPFDADDPVNTPRGLNTDATAEAALFGAVDDLRSNDIPIDATLRGLQFRQAADERITIPGGPGIYKNLRVRGSLEDGWEAWGGSSFVFWVELTPDGPVGEQIMVHSQSSNPASPHFTDQTRLFGEGEYREILFTEQQIASDPNLSVEVLRSPPPGCARANPNARHCP